jgi:hypothetical protein
MTMNGEQSSFWLVAKNVVSSHYSPEGMESINTHERLEEDPELRGRTKVTQYLGFCLVRL